MSAERQETRSAAIDRYVTPELPVLYRVALSLTRNHADAEDLVQDTLLRAYRSIERFNGEYPRAWLLTIMRNANINLNRRRRPSLMTDPEAEMRKLASTADGSDNPEQMVVDNRFDGTVADAFRALPKRFGQVVELVDIDGLSYQEAAAVLSIPAGTVMSRLHRGRSRMKVQLTSEGYFRGGRR